MREIEQQQLDMLKIKAESPVEAERETSCINAGCTNYGTSATSYMCTACFEKQKECELNNCNNGFDGPRYGTGNSRFYAHADANSHKSIQRLPSFRRLNDQDQTLYLSNSTFYNDKRAPAIAQTTQTNISTPYSYTNDTPQGKTLIIPIRMEPDAVKPGDHHYNQTETGVARAYSAGNTIERQSIDPISSSTTSASTRPYNVLGISKGDNHIGGPHTSTVNITSNGSSYPQNSRRSYADALKKTNTGILSSYIENIDEPNKSSRIATPFLQSKGQQCRTVNCNFFGSEHTDYYCSKCCQQLQQQQQQQQQPKTQSKILTDV